MSTDQNNNQGNVVGLQIGGTVGPNDKVGMHIPMPNAPGIGVQVQLGNELDAAVKEVSASLPSDHPKAAEVRKMVEEVLLEKNNESKMQKAHRLVLIGAGITQIAVGIGKITKLMDF